MNKFDVVVLGAGPGGYVAAIRAAQLGAKTAIVEKDAFGGTCLNRGCIPTKTFVKNAELLHNVSLAASRGIQLGEPELDMTQMQKSKDMIVKQLSSGVAGLLKANGVQIYQGTGTVTGDYTMEVEQEGAKAELEFEKLILATGSENFIPPIPGMDEGVMTSTELLNMDHIPKSLAIIGGGVIGCEFATVFQAMGTKVTIIEMQPRLIPNMDEGLSMQLKKSMNRKKIQILLNHSVSELKKTETGYEIHMKDLSTDEAAHTEAQEVLISIGRKPNMEGLENLRLELEGRYLKTNEFLQTSREHIYAIGDITGRIQLAHVASAQGKAAAEHALGRAEGICSLDVVPSCIYTIPEIGSVGLTEAAAREQYGEDLMIGNFPAAALGKALAMGEAEGSFKLIAQKSTKKLLGVHIFGANATDLIMEPALVIQAGGTIDMITNTIHAHPTMAEGMAEAAEAAEGQCIHMAPPKK